jgi:hypothetical protein
MARDQAELHRPQQPRLARVQFGEMVERRIEERKRVIKVEQKDSTQEGTHTRFRNLAASEPEGEKLVPRELKKSCKTQSPVSPNVSTVQPGTQWMMDNGPRTEEQADADWRRVTESLFGTNTRAEPKWRKVLCQIGEATYCPSPKN